jgi:hypothetical protein
MTSVKSKASQKLKLTATETTKVTRLRLLTRLPIAMLTPTTTLMTTMTQKRSNLPSSTMTTTPTMSEKTMRTSTVTTTET